MKQIKIALVIVLLLCLADMPYVYYTLVRLLSMIGFVILAYDCYTNKKEKLAIIFGALALLFQPFVKVALGRYVWNVVDVLVAVFLTALIINTKKMFSSKIFLI